jgi:hypothetical protein
MAESFFFIDCSFKHFITPYGCLSIFHSELDVLISQFSDLSKCMYMKQSFICKCYRAF